MTAPLLFVACMADFLSALLQIKKVAQCLK